MPKAATGPGSGPLALATVTETDPRFGTVVFETGRPVTFTFIRNTEKAPNMGSRYGQDIEPAGRYMLHLEGDYDAPRGWSTGTISFKNPIVLRDTLDSQIYGPNGWKARLMREMGGKKGRALTAALLSVGHDGIVTVTSTRGLQSTMEIVSLK